MGKTYDLEDRLLEFAAQIVRFVGQMSKTRTGHHVGGHLLRAGTSPLFNHGEAQGAESQRDFIHKLGVCLKELKECKRALRLVKKVPLVNPASAADPLLAETEELIKIFGASISTAKKNALSVRERIPDSYEIPDREETDSCHL